MELGRFKESNGGIGIGDDINYEYFEVHKTNDENDRVIILWKLNIFERILVLFTGRVWQQSLLKGGDLQETAITIDKPYMKKVEN